MINNNIFYLINRMSVMQKEYEFFLQNKMDNESGGPINTGNMYKWNIEFDGPKESDYEGGRFSVDINFPSDYPNSMPSCRFHDDVFHPNINEEGVVCFGGFIWKNDYTVFELLNALYHLLKHPNFGDGYNNKQVRDFYYANPEEYHEVVRDLVKEFHKPKK